ncbi:23S rRNA (adenine(2030)-N(6))-methyltransferase RlmJ [Pseudocolwellia sp. AS88]|uniref:23S rRNA (adenine(2030)-N(6))-methyltransferase RlmJ n=1 Tax=Pseudocolwellia sp. AS88 TaxID=3063958 RepID=UPI0026EE996D|nr:23S rRNA (adenine(2030)-N(6))-methyltransferase RlmJ [Pseudocolwellia sp. AS88]MDO7083546.1 23S rRNA (adenine(2030)-N(6))-methyltransferase RlmJ [Pseudocolwellia sp. AS88]
MLSYRHAFHAGNFADVLKHAVLTNVLEYMTRKDKGYTYIDSHSGAGMYQLTEEYAQKTGEYKQGIAKLINNDDIPEALEEYIALIQSFNQAEELKLYPGSPAVAKEFSRRQDSAHLFELHSTDINYLTEFCQRWSKSHVKQSDGYQGILSLLPPPSRRGVVLIDPPYELKEDYAKAVKTIISAYKKFATGTYILWYPVVKRELIDKMREQFIASDVKNVLQVEFCMQKDTDTYGMTGTGLYIVNPPWQLTQQLEAIMPYLKDKLGDSQSTYSLEQIIEE